MTPSFRAETVTCPGKLTLVYRSQYLVYGLLHQPISTVGIPKRRFLPLSLGISPLRTGTNYNYMIINNLSIHPYWILAIKKAARMTSCRYRHYRCFWLLPYRLYSDSMDWGWFPIGVLSQMVLPRCCLQSSTWRSALPHTIRIPSCLFEGSH